MLKRLMMTTFAVTVISATLAAQTRPAAPTRPAQPAPAATAAETKPEPAAPKTPEPPPLPVNIRIEVSITDQTGSNPAARKVVSMIASDRQSTNVRSSASVPVKSLGPKNPADMLSNFSYRNVTINVDARPSILQKEPTKISVNFGLEYLPKTASSQEEMEPGMTSWSERLSLILESGKPMIVSQAADPTSDRKITVELTATILK